MSKYEIRSKFECQNTILNVKIRNSVPVRMSKYDFECQNKKFGPSSNVKIGFCMSKYEIRSQFECQNRILNVKIRNSVPVRMSK